MKCEVWSVESRVGISSGSGGSRRKVLLNVAQSICTTTALHCTACMYVCRPTVFPYEYVTMQQLSSEMQSGAVLGVIFRICDARLSAVAFTAIRISYSISRSLSNLQAQTPVQSSPVQSDTGPITSDSDTDPDQRVLISASCLCIECGGSSGSRSSASNA